MFTKLELWQLRNILRIFEMDCQMEHDETCERIGKKLRMKVEKNIMEYGGEKDGIDRAAK